MRHQSTLTARQANRLNRILRLGIYKTKRIQEYPTLHRMLAKLLHATYTSTIAGKSAKHGFCGPELVVPDFHGKVLDLQYWEDKVGSYGIKRAHTSAWDTTLDLQSSLKVDVFLPDSFCLITKYATFTLDVSSKGVISWIQIMFEGHYPSFLRELVRDFPGQNPQSDRVILHKIKHRNENPDRLFTEQMSFRKVVTIEVP